MLLLYCFLTHEQQSVQSILRIGSVSNWLLLAKCAAAEDFIPTLDGDSDAVYQRYVRQGHARLALEGFLDGKDRQMDLIR